MTQQSRTTLKSYYETDDIPTQTQSEDNIDSVSNYHDDGGKAGSKYNVAAHAGGGQGSATVLVNRVNVIKTCATPGDSCKMEAGTPGDILSVWNDTANACDIFPASAGYINNLAVNNAYSLAADLKISLHCHYANYWFTH